MGPAVDRIVAWIKMQYDKVLAFTILFGLVVSLLYLAARASMVPNIQRAFKVGIDGLRPRHEHAAVVDTTFLEDAHGETQKPFQLVHDEWTNALPAALFVPESRVWCAECNYPIPYAVLSCTFCPAEQPPIEDEYDSDGDGMSDKWEKEYGLDPRNPADAHTDEDGDGFSNLSEFTGGKTDPTDKDSFPPIIDVIQLVEIKPEPFHLKFVGKVVLPSGEMMFQLNTRRHTQTVWVKKGETTPDGFTAMKYVEKIAKEKVAGGGTMLINVDKSELTLKRGKELITLVKGRERIHPAFKAFLQVQLMGDEEPIKRVGKVGEVFEMKGKEYGVLSIDNTNDFVLIRDVEKGTQKRIVK
jgi:hypothetical protein